MNSIKFSARFFSSTPSSKPSSNLPWISPLQFLKPTSKTLPDPPQSPIETPPRKPKFISHETAVTLIKNEKSPQKALEIFNKVSTQKGFNHNNSTYAVILHKLAFFKKFNAVEGIIHQMRYETCRFNEGIFVNLMTHYAKSLMFCKVVEMFDCIELIVRDKPSLKAISSCLNILVEGNEVALARRFLLNVRKDCSFVANTCIFNILVKYHCKRGDLDSAFEVVEEMKKEEVSRPNLITYSTLMTGLCVNGRLQDAFDLFEEMVSKYQILPDALTYNVLISGFCQNGKVDRGRKILDFMRKNGCMPNIINYSTLMNGFLKEGRFKDVKEVFDEIKNAGLKPDKICYTTLITCMCRSGAIDEAIEVLEEMKHEECRTDTVIFNVILGGLCSQNRFDEALEMLERLPLKGIFLNKASYRIVLNSLCKEEELEKASRLLGMMLSRGFVPHFATSNELLAQLCKAGMAADATTTLFGMMNMGFKPEPDSWSLVIDLICRERKLVSVFELLDELT
ncbi:Pentatricopeptide repeat-containing protein [Heracleum sosnowskyi]|uniref:Pentatricopeptide repeat-containing protein n=1 Tax=Heracleum sosnowskyi TaxID=360622 RepID=A0AAD8JGH8_9APIA|nr:Pentatricopeptide repeat-containing protein [Heracleum sosnowskyi]